MKLKFRLTIEFEVVLFDIQLKVCFYWNSTIGDRGNV